MVLFALLVLCAAWLHVIGLPGFIMEALRQSAAAQGLHLNAHSIHVRWHRGLVAHGVVLFNPEDRITPAARVSELKLNLNLREGFRSGAWIEGLTLAGAELRDPFAIDSAHATTLEALRLDLRFVPGGLAFDRVGFQFHGLALEGKGRYFADPASRASSSAERTVPSLRDIHRELKKMEPVLSILSRIQFGAPPRFDCEFVIDEHDPANNQVGVACNYAEGAVFEGCRFDGLQFQAEFKDSRIAIHRATLMVPGGYARAELSLDSRLRLQRAEASIDLSESQVRTLLPDELRDELLRGEVEILGRVAGTLSYSNVIGRTDASRFAASVSADRGKWRGIPLRDFTGTVERRPGRLFARIPSVRVGEGRGSGPVGAEVTVDPGNGFFEGQVDVGCAPATLLEATRDVRGLRSILNEIAFVDEPGRARLAFSGATNGDHFWLEGPIQGTNLVFRGVSFDSLSALLTLSDHNVRLSGVEARQQGEPISGSLLIRHDPPGVVLDVRGSVPPQSLAPLIGPSFVRAAATVKLEGPLHYRVNGTVDTGHNLSHHLQGEMMCGRVGYQRWDARSVQVYWTLTGNLLTFPHVEGTLDEGRLSGLVQVADLNSPSNRYFFVEATSDRMNLGLFLSRLGVERNDPNQGKLSGRISLEGRSGANWADSLQGSGRLEVRDGALFQVAFFGGLSKWLSRLLPGFGYAQQTDLESSFTLGNRTITLPDARLLGNVISAYGSGSIGFDRRLNLLVQVKLLKNGMLAKAVQLLSWPITKLFEFKVIGTLDQPDWRPDNLPKELFLKFD